MCRLVTEAGADFIKTSTGFSKGGATFEDVALFAKHVGPNVRIKAAGGISSIATLWATNVVPHKKVTKKSSISYPLPEAFPPWEVFFISIYSLYASCKNLSHLIITYLLHSEIVSSGMAEKKQLCCFFLGFSLNICYITD